MKLFAMITVGLFLLAGCASSSGTTDIIPIQSSVKNLDEAAEFALRLSHLNADDVEFGRKEMLGRGGNNICELEYVSNAAKYKCYINVDTGMVIKYDFDGSLSNAGSILGQAEITDLLKTFAPDIKEDSIDMNVDKSNDDGITVYEGIASGDKYQYSFEISATSGTLVEWDSTLIENE